MKMPFGKYKDRELEQVPKHYLQWLYANIKMNEALRRAVVSILKDEEVERPWNLNEQVEKMFRRE